MTPPRVEVASPPAVVAAAAVTVVLCLVVVGVWDPGFELAELEAMLVGAAWFGTI